MGPASVMQMGARIAALMEERLGARGGSLEEKLRHRGRRLPPAVRAEAAFLARCVAEAGNPALFMRLDHARIGQAYDLCLRHLKSVNRWERRAGLVWALLRRLAVIAMGVAALVLALAWWRGVL